LNSIVTPLFRQGDVADGDDRVGPAAEGPNLEKIIIDGAARTAAST
jgi:hypothetical protein